MGITVCAGAGTTVAPDHDNASYNIYDDRRTTPPWQLRSHPLVRISRMEIHRGWIIQGNVFNHLADDTPAGPESG